METPHTLTGRLREIIDEMCRAARNQTGAVDARWARSWADKIESLFVRLAASEGQREPIADPSALRAGKTVDDYIRQASMLSGCSWGCYRSRVNADTKDYCSSCQSIAKALADAFACGAAAHPVETGETPQQQIDDQIRGDAATLRGYINTYGETPSMTASNREHWKRRAHAAEARLSSPAERPALDLKTLSRTLSEAIGEEVRESSRFFMVAWEELHEEEARWAGVVIEPILRAALAGSDRPAPRAEAASEAWQPISTAPKDGRLLLYFEWFKQHEVKHVAIGQHHPIQGWIDCVTGGWIRPTHWMPLPPPPGEAPEREA